ncbi:hypothetical protein N7539_007699 [Penicillium diatomitis]|uniref:Uncharacterized protein n=1 Tax=Penicillium diatomitis TaxID=2819901 RepID=A0A9W9WTU3_9EURO|nr:uncharacterized protein N7539_007699 [Penicillium diatomitis]KAJ5475412.1 hypothetical protein N7539_007699 [Penicillium diatomitis]
MSTYESFGQFSAPYSSNDLDLALAECQELEDPLQRLKPFTQMTTESTSLPDLQLYDDCTLGQWLPDTTKQTDLGGFDDFNASINATMPESCTHSLQSTTGINEPIHGNENLSRRKSELLSQSASDNRVVLNRSSSTIRHLNEDYQTWDQHAASLSRRFEKMDGSLNNVQDRLSRLEPRLMGLELSLDKIDGYFQQTEAHLKRALREIDILGDKFKTLDSIMLEVIRREQIAMQEIGELAGRYNDR